MRVLVRHGERHDLGQPGLERRRRFISFSSNWRFGHQIYLLEVATGKERRLSGLTCGRLRAAVPSATGGGGLREPGAPGADEPSGGARPESGEERVLVDWPALNYDPAYSPDGSEIAFASNITGEYAIYRQRLADGQSWRVTFGPGPARYPDYRRA